MYPRGRKAKKGYPFQLYILGLAAERVLFVGYYKTYDDALEAALNFVRNGFSVQLLERNTK